MKRVFVVALAGLLLIGGFQAVHADDCVDVDIELPASIVAEPGTVATGYFELTNCGDEAADIELYFDITLIVEIGPDVDTLTFGLGAFPVPVEAGETLSREFRFPVNASPGTITATICVTATAGEAEASDCATMVVEESALADGSLSKKFGMMMATGEGCVEVDLELPDTLFAESMVPLYGEGYFELTNCGDEAATIMLTVEASISIGGLIDTTIVFPDFPVELEAGGMISRDFTFPVPPFDGVYTVCVTATSDEAVAVSCQTMVVVGSEYPGVPFGAPGTLVQGTECVLFAPMDDEDHWLVLDDYGTFQVGDTVCVSGVLVIGCDTECTDAFGCLQDNVISTCGPPVATGIGPKNYPNPFNPRTMICFDLPQSSHVTLTVYNALGQEVRLLRDETMSAGSQQIEWNGTDDSGNRVSTGIYFYKIKTDSFTETRKMLMVK